MEGFMNSRYLMIASAALALAGGAAAEPVKPADQPTVQPANNRPAEVVLASAEQAPTPAGVTQAQAAAPVKKPRAARVTSCRCAGQTPENER
jgi:hypothetical protein